jgi:DNA polymerase III subunit gamma/tau
MSYQVLARKYRPQKFSDVIGQDHVTRTLQNAIEQGRIAHGYIFSGHRGIGKTTVARILAMALNCQSSAKPVAEPCGVCDSCREIREGSMGSMNVVEVDAATNRGIDEVKAIIATAAGQPTTGTRYRIFILDEAHQVTDAAFNALLKTLEEPPEWVVFMMATTQPEDIPQTIRSRCQHFSFHAVKFDDIVGQLTDIAKQEGIKADADAIALLAEAGDGSMRDALSIMDQAIACCGNILTAEVVRGLVGTVASGLLEEVLASVQRNSSEEVLRHIDKLLVEGHSAVHFARQLVRFLRNALVAKVAGAESHLLQISPEERQRVGRVAEMFTEEDLTRFLQIMLRTHNELGYKQEQRFHLELGLLKLVHAQRMLPLEQILSGASASPSSQATPARTSPAAPARTLAQERPSTPFSRPAARSTEPPADTRAVSRPSPFESDRARKSRTEMSAETTTPVSVPGAMMTATAVAVAVEEPPAPEPQTNGEFTVESLRDVVLEHVAKGEQKMLADTLGTAQWALSGTEMTVTFPMSPKMLDMTMTPELKRTISTAMSRTAGTPIRLKPVSGGVDMKPVQSPMRVDGGPGVRTRAADDPIVKRMVEKFGAEIRTVIDHREK